jgi:hypothetical protein
MKMTVADSIFSFFKKDFPTETSNPFLGSVIQRNLVKTLCKVFRRIWDSFNVGRTGQAERNRKNTQTERDMENRKGRT